MEIIPIETAQDNVNQVPQEGLQIAPQPPERVQVPWVVRSLLHSLRHGGEGWDDDLNRAQDLPDLQLLALVNALTHGTSEVHVLQVIDNWYQQLKQARADAFVEKIELDLASVPLAA